MGVPFPALKTMVTVFLLLMGNTSPVVLSPSTPLSTVKLFASKVVTPGSSLACGLQEGMVATGYKVTCIIQVENWTRYPLMVPRLRIANDGAATTNPSVIAEAKREAFAVRKASGTATGVYGTVSWELQGANRRFVLMWSAPFDFNHHSNWMGLGMTKEGSVDVAEGNTWFDQMYYYSNTDDLTFERKEFYSNTDSFIYRDNKFEVEGDMTNGHNAVIRVVVRPISNYWDDLAYEIRRKLD